MSAIAGIYHLNDEPINLEHGNRIMKALEKYPADDIQTWHNDKVFLGCHAQWITPESLGEKLPYYDHDRKLAITADAIIDNREELFERLQVDKGKRKDITDSELILLSYYKWEEDAPKYLVGDFAFMIWDEKKQKLFGARDPLGYRTLYYYKENSSFTFCTVIEPIISLPHVNKILNEKWLAEFLVLSLLIDTVDATMTPYLNINQVPPFHSIKIEKGKINISKYGKYFSDKKIKFKKDFEYVEAFQEIFNKAVKDRLRTHRNVGSHLSGGLDSGAVVGFAAKELKKVNKVLHTFSYIPPGDFIDFTSKRFMADERPFIKKTVDYIGGINDHYYDFEGISSYTEIDEMLEVNEMPYKFIENSFWLKGTFEKASLEDVRVLLNGDVGNSTISWGNSMNYYAVLLKRLKWIKLAMELDQYSKKVGGARFGNLPIIARTAFPYFKRFQGIPNSVMRIVNLEFAKKTLVFEKLRSFGIDDSGCVISNDIHEQRKVIYDYIHPYNASNTLYSKLSLKYSVWKRDPTSDLRVVRFCFAVPEEQYVMSGMDRALIRRSTKNILPDDIRLNQKIRGIQAADWIHRITPDWDNLLCEVKQLIKDKRVDKFIDKKEIKIALMRCEKSGPIIEDIGNMDYKLIIRCVVLYRYLINNFF
ncbi:asparagine synthase-related protein [Bacillus sp. 1P10SD]|uniref:asparagine synthase-related protein n=1 Tax=Bacillus sp. 1P10SD TaxID=3132265 RepID=UPI0039A661F4